MIKAFRNLAMFSFILSVLIVPFVTSAAVIRSDKEAIVPVEENISGNVYLVGGEPKSLGEVNGDVFALGNDIEVGGVVNGDIISAGGNLNINAVVNGDVRVSGGTVSVENTISGDVVVFGSNITIKENAKIGGDLILIGGVVNLKNDSEKHVRVISRSTIIEGSILNSANITSEKITILKGSEIKGELSYFSPVQAHIEEGATVSGSANFNKVDSIRENGLVKHTIVSFLNFWMLFRFVTTLILTFIIVYVFKIFAQKTALQSITSFWKSLLVGLATFVFVPVIGIVFLISLILLPVAILLGMIYTGVFIISTAIAGIALGALLKKTFTKNKNFEVSFNTATIGVIVLTVLQFVTVIGDITRYVFIFAAFGAVWIYLYEKVRWGNSLNN